MKKIVFLMLALAICSGCSKYNVSRSKGFTHTGCSAETRSNALFGDEPSLLTLQYENGDLRVIRSNAMLNCAIKERGLTCKASVDGDAIHYYIDYEIQSDLETNCICPVAEMTSVVSGLHEGKEYTFHYCGLDRYLKPFTFTFTDRLHQIIDVDTL